MTVFILNGALTRDLNKCLEKDKLLNWKTQNELWIKENQQ
jgi:hypothetical protein